MDPVTAKAAVESGIKIFKELDKEQQNKILGALTLGTETFNALTQKGGEMTINNANEFLSSFHQAMKDPEKSKALAEFAQNAGKSFESVVKASTYAPFHIVGKTGNMVLAGVKNTGGLVSSFFKGVGNLFVSADEGFQTRLQERQLGNIDYQIVKAKKLQELKAISGMGERFTLGLKFATLAVCVLFITVLIVWIGADYSGYEEYDKSAGTKAVIFIGIMSLVLLMANAGAKKK